MKKIITLLFFASFVTIAFAQDDRHEQMRDQYNGNEYPYSNYSRDNNYHKDYQWHNQNEYNYGYRRDRDGGDRDNREYRDHEGYGRFHNYYWEQDHPRRDEDYYYRNNRGGAWFQVVIGSHRHE